MGSRTWIRKTETTKETQTSRRSCSSGRRLRAYYLIGTLWVVLVAPLQAEDSGLSNFNDLKSVYDKGSSYLESGYLQEAKEYFTRAIELNNTFAPAYHGLGIVYYQLGALDEAILNLKKSHDLGINNAKVHYVMAVTYTRLGDVEEARAAYERAIEINPDFLQAYHNLGLLYFQDQRWDKAQENLEKALILNPESTKVIFALGLLYIKDGVPEKAFDMITLLRNFRDETKAVKLESILRPPPGAPQYLTEPDPSLFEPILPKPAQNPGAKTATSQGQEGRISITGRVQVTMQGVSPDASQ